MDELYLDGFVNLGNAYFYLKEYDDAIKNYDQSIRLNPQNADYYVNRGLAYMSKGDNATAVADFEKALSLDPSNNKAKINLQKIESES